MAFDWGSFDPENERGIGAIPDGEYRVIITACETRATSKGDGQLLETKFDVIEGQYTKSKLVSYINIDNPNQAAVQIARAELASMCRACNMPKPAGPHDFVNKILKVKVGHQTYEGKDRNRITDYLPAETTTAPKPTAANGGSKPWERKK